jgi:hypothetical protein
MPFDTIDDQGGLAHVANILTFTRRADIIKHVLKALRGKMGVMQIQLREVTLEHDALGKIGFMLKKVSWVRTKSYRSTKGTKIGTYEGH